MKKIFLLIVLSLSLSFTINSFAQNISLDVNDVSVLLPLPDLDHWNLLPQGTTLGKNGALLPLAYLKPIPQILSLASNQKVYPMLRVLGIRIDPCFTEGSAPVPCRPQIRMVWQPLAQNDESTSTFDASLHSFYDLTPDQFKELVVRIKQLKSEKTNTNEILPLGINPILQKDGLDSDYAQKFFSIINSYVGESNLSRITFMQLFMNGNIWEFGGFNITHNADQTFDMQPIVIPRVNTTSQKFKNSATPQPIWFIGGMDPEPVAEDNINILVRDSRALSAQQNEAEITAAVRSAFKFENPGMHNPGTVDCASCHAAQAAKIWTLNEYPWFNLPNSQKDVIYASDRNIQNISPLQNQTNILRAFGYFMEKPIASQRVINESAEVVKFINLNY